VQRQRERLTVARCSVGPAAAIQAAATCTRDYATSIHRIDYECVNDSQVAPCHSGTTDVAAMPPANSSMTLPVVDDIRSIVFDMIER
jgi:hypothetical protein